MLEDKLADIWPDYSCLYDVRCPQFQGFVHIFRLAALKRLPLRRNNKRNSKVSSSSDELRVPEWMGGETSQLALARCVMRGVLGQERSRGRTIEKWRVKIKFCSTLHIQSSLLRMNGKTFFVAVW